jgi:hypothetical protein
MPKLTSPSPLPGLYLGIDPGASGGLACFSRDDVSVIKMPPTEGEVWNWVRSKWYEPGMKPYAVIEMVTGWIPGKENKPDSELTHGGSPGSAMFKFGVSYGGLRMALTAAGIPFVAVPPRVWQAALGVEPRHHTKIGRRKVWTESQPQFKRRLKELAITLFPSEKVIGATADALLLACYCRLRVESGNWSTEGGK